MAGQEQPAQEVSPEGPVARGQSTRRRIVLVAFVTWIFAVVNGLKLAAGLEARTPFAVVVFLILCVAPLGLAGFLWRERG